MGGNLYWYYAKYQNDIETTLQTLRQQEFTAGRYNPVIPFLDFPIAANSPSPGSQHGSIEEAMEATEADGTRSILDIFSASTIPYLSALALSNQGGIDLVCTTFPLSTDELITLFSTERPTHELVEAVIVLFHENQEATEEFWNHFERGICRHIVIYDDSEPTEVFFIGLSFD